MKQTFHMSLNIEGALRFYGKKSMKGLITEDNGAEWTDKMVKDYLRDCLKKGWKLIPCCGKECEGFDHQTGCPGHPVNE
jgi:hypothetical protein